MVNSKIFMRHIIRRSSKILLQKNTSPSQFRSPSGVGASKNKTTNWTNSFFCAYLFWGGNSTFFLLNVACFLYSTQYVAYLKTGQYIIQYTDIIKSHAKTSTVHSNTHTTHNTHKTQTRECKRTQQQHTTAHNSWYSGRGKKRT